MSKALGVDSMLGAVTGLAGIECWGHVGKGHPKQKLFGGESLEASSLASTALSQQEGVGHG